MFSLRNVFASALLGLCLSCVPALAADTPPLSSEAVQRSLDKIADRKLSADDQKALQQVL